MAKADLHCHSCHSDRPSEWFLQKLGARESYSTPEMIFAMAQERGMDFVTITDHNTMEASLRLKERYPERVLTGVEVTSYFPDNGCKVHVLLFGLSVEQFEIVQEIRKDIFDLREFLIDEDLAYSVAHPTFAVNERLTFRHLEQLIILFDVFESVNGARGRLHNESFTLAMKNLTSDHLWDLYKKYRIEPFSDEPWIKSFTGGSDDHGGVFIGTSYTLAEAHDAEQFLERLKRKETHAEGRHNDYQSLAFTIYKIAYDFYRVKRQHLPHSLLSEITESVFEKKSISLMSQAKSSLPRSIVKRTGGKLNESFFDIIETLRRNGEIPVEKKLSILYDKISDIADDLLGMFLMSSIENLKNGDIFNLVRDVSTSLPAFFLAAPFFSTFYHINKGRDLIEQLQKAYGTRLVRDGKRILWFTDSLTDLNGVSITLMKIGRIAVERNLDLRIAASLTDEEMCEDIPSTVMRLPHIHEFRLPYYERYLIKVPSILKSLKTICEFDPDEIVISTPGPVGLLGILVSRLLKVKSVGIYHTDFLSQATEISGNESLASFLEAADRWFTSSVDEIHSPSADYVDRLESRGLDRSRIQIFRKGVDTNLFYPRQVGRRTIREHFGLEGGKTLLSCGRISKDKNLDFLMEVYGQLAARRDDVNLLVVGDGPYFAELEETMKYSERVVFTGSLKYEALPDIYSGSDLLLFPSTTDTFGNVVLEAQACGCPAIVSNRGGPKEIVVDRRTGYVLGVSSPVEWVERVEYLLDLMEENSSRWLTMKAECRKNAVHNFSLEGMCRHIMGTLDGPSLPDVERRELAVS